jgi:NADH:ubiquinone oxidoreductase subunit 6 (subunit J)
MQLFLDYIPVMIIFLLGAVVIVLLAGVIGMAVGGKVTPRVRNHFMKARVAIQTLILLLVVILVVATWVGDKQ